MSVLELIDAKVSQLPPELQAQVLDFVEYLDFKQSKEKTESVERLPNRFGAGKDVITYIAEDFDAPPDDFKEYM